MLIYLVPEICLDFSFTIMILFHLFYFILFFRTDITNNKFEWDFFAPRLELAFDYKISGRVLVLPISGSGPGNFTLSKIYTNLLTV